MLRFNTTSPIIIENDLVLDEADCQSLWYCPSELEFMKESLVETLQHLIKKKKVISRETRNTLINLYDRCAEPCGMKLTRVQMIDLVRFYMSSADVVGLEYVIMGKHQDRALNTSLVLEAIDSIQDKTDAELMGFDRAEIIRKKCLKLTHRSRTFASHLGMAKSASAVLAASANKEDSIPGGVAGSNPSANPPVLKKSKKTQMINTAKELPSRRSLMMAQKRRVAQRKGLDHSLQCRSRPERDCTGIENSLEVVPEQKMGLQDRKRNSLVAQREKQSLPRTRMLVSAKKQTRTRNLIAAFEARSSQSTKVLCPQ